MAANGYDPVDGSPLFSDSDAPDIKVDPRAVAIYAAEVGNRIVKANLAALDAYPYKRKGLRGHALDTSTEYEHDGTGWVLAGGSTTIPITSFSTGWSALAGYEPYLLVQGKRRTLVGAASRNAGGVLSSILTIPVGHRPARNMFLGAHSNGATQFYELLLTPAGTLQVPGGYGTASSLGAHPIGATWELD
ncbi:hypothetical protein [Microbacterium sp. NPDC055599]